MHIATHRRQANIDLDALRQSRGALFGAGMAWALVAYVIGMASACLSLWLLSLVA